MSRLFARRKQSPKKATTVVSTQTLEKAIQEAEELTLKLMEANHQDERLEQLDDAISFLSSVLKKNPLEMQQEGASSLEDYLDDAVMPEMANKIKKEVDMIAQIKGSGEQQPDRMGNLPDDRTVEMNNRANEWDKKTIQDRPSPRAASGADNWVSDRDNDGEPKETKEASGADSWVSDRVNGEPEEPVLAEVPRLASSKNFDLFYGASKQAAPVTQMPSKPKAKPSADITQLSSDTLAKMQKALAGSEDLMNDKAAQAFIAAIAEELMNRPVEQEAPEQPKAQPAAAPAPMPMAASFAGLTLAAFDEGGFDEDGDVASGQAAGSSEEDSVREETCANCGRAKNQHIKLRHGNLECPISHYFSPKKASGQGGSWFVNDGETGEVVEGTSTPEISEAHGMLEDNTGIPRPATELPSKFAEDMTTGSALKKVEKAGDDLKALYLETKRVTKTLDSRPVREAIEAIYRAYDMMGEAAKVLNKQKMQEEAEEKATEIKEKNKKSSLEMQAGKEYKCSNCDHEKSEHKNGRCVTSPKMCKCTKWQKVGSLFGLDIAGEEE